MMHVYITLHRDVFLAQQLAALAKFCPGATVHLVATLNASPDIAARAAFRLHTMPTPALVSRLLPFVADGPGMILEWDIIPIKPIVVRNAITLDDVLKAYPSVLMWRDKSELVAGYGGLGAPPFVGDCELLPHKYLIDGCGAGMRFTTIGDDYLHFHHWAAYGQPLGLTPERLACWQSLVAPIVGDVAPLPPPPATPMAEPPPFFQKLANFATSAARHVAAGMPQASQDEIDRRFAICQGCEQFDGKACRLCGCPVVREKQFVSKLSWANESCPVGKWGPVGMEKATL